MMNSGKLAGKTIFISGATRGIGKAIALKAAKDGANIIIAAKTVKAHPQLPGTIYTAATEVEQAGGQCLAVPVDIRSDDQVYQAVEDAVKKFGGIDILINNASAISLTGTMETPMKKYDLMNSVNARGTYLCSQACLPYLKSAKNAHILNISPPLNMNPKWFMNHVAYTQAKYGMSMCVLGMAEEFKKDGIAVNALWPRTAIHTSAMDMLGGDDISKQCRNVDIMSDAAYAMLTKDSRSYTGQFAIDEDVLKDVGVTDFDRYACSPGHALMPDFFLDEPAPKDSTSSEKKAEQPAGEAKGVEEVLNQISTLLTEEMVDKIKGVFQFEIKDSDEHWWVDLKNGAGSFGKGQSPQKANCTMKLTTANFLKMFSGELNATTAFMTGRLRIEGDMMLAMKLEKLIKKFHSLKKSKL